MDISVGFRRTKMRQGEKNSSIFFESDGMRRDPQLPAVREELRSRTHTRTHTQTQSDLNIGHD